jgi:small GTP-binding protein
MLFMRYNGYYFIYTFLYKFHLIVIIWRLTYEIEWLVQIKQHAQDKIPILLLGNKTDLKDKRLISYEEASKFAEDMGLKYIETSAKNGSNVNESFYLLSDWLVSEM